MAKERTIDTWKCPNCGYTQDFDPNDKKQVIKSFGYDMEGNCPACARKKSRPTKEDKKEAVVSMEKVSKDENKSVLRVADDDEIESRVGEDGEPLSVEYIEKIKKQAEKAREKWDLNS